MSPNRRQGQLCAQAWAREAMCSRCTTHNPYYEASYVIVSAVQMGLERLDELVDDLAGDIAAAATYLAQPYGQYT